MKLCVLILVVLQSLLSSVGFAQQRKGKQPTLTRALAQRILNRQINEESVNNVLFTCRACYNPDDKEENDNFPLVTTYSAPLVPFLIKQGYVRRSRNGDQVFTARAKRSKYFETYGDGRGGFGGAGLRFADFKNPKILITKITDLKRVPIEYDFVPTDLTMKFFGKVLRTSSFASYSYEDGKWNVCIGCQN